MKEFHIDFDSILEKCISSDQAEAWFSGRLITKINRFYHDKWKDKITGFEDIKLQSDILSTVATLQEFCKALDPDHESAPGASVRRLRIKLRDNYVKLHPDNYITWKNFLSTWILRYRSITLKLLKRSTNTKYSSVVTERDTTYKN